MGWNMFLKFAYLVTCSCTNRFVLMLYFCFTMSYYGFWHRSACVNFHTVHVVLFTVKASVVFEGAGVMATH